MRARTHSNGRAEEPLPGYMCTPYVPVACAAAERVTDRQLSWPVWGVLCVSVMTGI